MPPAHNTSRGWANHPSHASGPTPGHTPTLTPYKEPAHPLLGNEQGNLLLVFVPPCGSRGPNKALPEFLVWPLINFFWLRRPRSLISIRITWETLQSSEIFPTNVRFLVKWEWRDHFLAWEVWTGLNSRAVREASEKEQLAGRQKVLIIEEGQEGQSERWGRLGLTYTQYCVIAYMGKDSGKE